MKQNLRRMAAWTIVAAMLLSVHRARADEAADQSSDTTSWPPEAKIVHRALEPILETLEPKASVEFEDATLIVAFRPQKFKIHGRSLLGDIAVEAHDEIGPSYKGIVLRAYLQPLGTVNMAETPQTVREPYWSTDLDVAPVGKTDKQIYWGLSYGSRTDKQVLDKIRLALRGLGE